VSFFERLRAVWRVAGLMADMRSERYQRWLAISIQRKIRALETRLK
jgi:hypothetical protein